MDAPYSMALTGPLRRKALVPNALVIFDFCLSFYIVVGYDIQDISLFDHPPFTSIKFGESPFLHQPEYLSTVMSEVLSVHTSALGRLQR